MATYSPKYYVRYDGNKYGYISGRLIQKPKREKGPTENLRIYAKELACLGKKRSILWRNEFIDVISFDKPIELYNSIIIGFQKNSNVSKSIISQVEKRLSNIYNQVFWDADLDYHEINEIGKYLNEVLIGYKLLKERQADSFHIPINQNYPGIDSFITRNLEYIPISSKYGVGAVPQLFGLIGKIPFENFDHRTRNSQIYRLMTSYADLTSQRHAVYDFALRKILRLNIDIDKFYEDCKKNYISADVKYIGNLIADCCDNEKIKKAFPQSVTSWLERVTVEAINACPLSIEIIKEHLRELQLYQYHLDKDRWYEGYVSFVEKKTWQCPFKVTIGKSLLNNLEANRGLLCYRIGSPDENL